MAETGERLDLARRVAEILGELQRPPVMLGRLPVVAHEPVGSSERKPRSQLTPPRRQSG